MKGLIKKLLRENLAKTELGNREDARWASKMPTYPPFINLMVQVDTDFGRDSEIYRALLEYFANDGKDLNGVLHILKAFNVEDNYMHFLNVNETMIDGQNMNQGTETVCNKMSVATYAEGIKLITAAIGKPEQNPKMWQRIAKPLNNWELENIEINHEKETEHMSGDSMVDESNTYWTMIQNVICEQGGDGLHENINNQHLIPVNVGHLIYHKSNPIFRDAIKKQGLIPKGKSEAWLSDTNINGKVIFASNSSDEDDWFDSTYDDDIYQIDTTKINNKWFKDPNFDDDAYVITFEPIPKSALKLIYKGSGEEYL